jgi:hypothetical protein
VFYALDDAPSVYRAYRAYFAGAPDEVTAEAIVFSSPFPVDPHLPEPVHGWQALVVAAVYSGDADAGMKELQGLRELAMPLADISQPMPFSMVQSAFDGVLLARPVARLLEVAVRPGPRGRGDRPDREERHGAAGRGVGVRARLPRRLPDGRGGQPDRPGGDRVRRALRTRPRLARRQLDQPRRERPADRLGPPNLERALRPLRDRLRLPQLRRPRKWRARTRATCGGSPRSRRSTTRTTFSGATTTSAPRAPTSRDWRRSRGHATGRWPPRGARRLHRRPRDLYRQRRPRAPLRRSPRRSCR